ncbi:hypothetical protein SAMN05216382_1789 [Sphingomonas palmae]|uniref:Uncharacterized protein n=1 Tax=Sphingomonas palmae TaxID=1855283 RepID=A0A1H7P9E0_9SPHN|nr:hypothetical protein [Sphingomonas palmae]SEL32064.1 hypothetical protein SAMN05216382_1789 [Sphingomonas palmae]
MQRYFFSLRIAALVIVAGIAYASLDLWWHGFVVVRDPRHLVAAVAIEGDGQRRPMRAYSTGYWVARPTIDGVISIACRNGVQVHRGDVQPGRQLAYTVTRDDCARTR